MTIEEKYNREKSLHNKSNYKVSHPDSGFRGLRRSPSGLRRSPPITNLNKLVQGKAPTTIATNFLEFDDITNTIENMNREQVIVPLYADYVEFNSTEYFNYYLKNDIKLYEQSLNKFKANYEIYNFPNIGVIDFAISIKEKNLIPKVNQFDRNIWLVEAYVKETNDEFTGVTIPMLSEEVIFQFRNLELEFYQKYKEQVKNRRLSPLSYFKEDLSTENQWVLGLHCVKKDNGKIDILNLNVKDFDPTNVVALNNKVKSCEVHETFVYKANVVIIDQEDTVVVFKIPSLFLRVFNAKKSELELR